MNFYQRHVGDYLRNAAHLSLLEHGVYVRLMDVYYSREAPIPHDSRHRVVGARSDDECAAVDAVLSEFFTLHEGNWTQARCDEEIHGYQNKPNTPTKAAERQRRFRERRSTLFAELRTLGIVPPMETSNRDLEAMLDNALNNVTSRTEPTPSNVTETLAQHSENVTETLPERFCNVTETANHKPITNNHKPKDLSLVGNSSDVPLPDGVANENPGLKKRLGPSPSEFDEFFAEFKRLYPKRKGDLNLKKARDTIRGKLSAGNWQERADVVLQGVAKFAAHCEREGKIGTEYVPMMSTWVNGERWHEDYEEPVKPEAPKTPLKVLIPAIEEFKLDPGLKRAGNLGAFSASKQQPSRTEPDPEDELRRRALLEQARREHLGGQSA